MDNKKAKIVYIKGGLGNQLFQYAFANFLSRKFNFDITLNISWFHNQKLRKFELNNFLNNFNYPITNVDSKIIDRIYAYRTEFIISNLLKKNLSLPIRSFNGYWQDIFFAEFLRNEIVLNNNCYEKVIDHEYYVIHLRRGDFIDSKVHHVLSDTYYIQNVELFYDKPIYVLSHDKDIAKKFIKDTGVNAKLIECNEYTAFNIIKNASGGIASNSTFCWWAIFISQSRNWILPYKWLAKKNIFKHNLQIEGTIIR